jgi:hypothetical protein
VLTNKLLILKILLSIKKEEKFKSLLDKVYPDLFRTTNVKEYKLVVGMESGQKFEQEVNNGLLEISG